MKCVWVCAKVKQEILPLYEQNVSHLVSLSASPPRFSIVVIGGERQLRRHLLILLGAVCK